MSSFIEAMDKISSMPLVKTFESWSADFYSDKMTVFLYSIHLKSLIQRGVDPLEIRAYIFECLTQRSGYMTRRVIQLTR